jgi:hypothetical protein
MNAQTGIVNIRGKEYQTVALRVQLFRQQHPDHSLTTSVVARDEDCVVMQATIADPTGRVIANGHSEEYRKSSQINKTSALENAETSAIGRALAAFGLGGTEFASANEVQNAIHQQAAGGAPPGRSQGEGAVGPAEHPSNLREQLEQSVEQGKKAPAHSALKTRLRGFVHELHGCGDGDELSAFLATPDAIAIIADTREKLPHLWDGSDWPEGIERPEEFVPLADVITKRQRECAEATAAYIGAG